MLKIFHKDVTASRICNIGSDSHSKPAGTVKLLLPFVFSTLGKVSLICSFIVQGYVYLV